MSKMGLHGPFGHLQHTLWQKKGSGIKLVVDSLPLKFGNRPHSSACRWSAIHHWKDLKDSYKFTLDLIPIRGLRKELWSRKILRVQTGTVLGLLLGNPETKSHSDVGVMERCKEYYMREGGGFPRVWVVVSLMSPKLPVA
jgi:hypothetical protein